MADDAHSLAVFIDFENLALGLAPRGGGRRAKKTDVLDMQRVLERLVEKGKVVAKRAYADWARFSEYTTSAAVKALPLWKVTPSRSLKVHSVAVALADQLNAKSGAGLPSRPGRTSLFMIFSVTTKTRLFEIGSTSEALPNPTS